ncbi:LysR family transcriptional regulator [[Pasteurella] aerogenes]
MNKLDALRYFCVASETLNFRETAVRLSVSPQVISRTIAELENTLGEPLFKRNTRNVQLTEFGQQFLVEARQFLNEEARLFSFAKTNQQAIQGTVRITLPPLPHHTQILADLLQAIAPYPNLTIDWRVDLTALKTVDNQIDMDIRICQKPEPDWITHHLATVEEKIVVSPTLIEKLGMPADLTDLAKRYPLAAMFNALQGRIWQWQINAEQTITPLNPKFISNDMASELQATRSGQVCSQLLDMFCQPYLDSGELVELFPDIPKQPWQIYLYRPYQTVTPLRIVKVFELLREILSKRLDFQRGWE